MELIYRKKGFGKTALLNDTQNFVFFDTLVYPMGCWHQDKFEASEENEAYYRRPGHPVSPRPHDR